MKIREIIETLERIAPPSYQESYDNCGLLTGNADWNCTGVLCTLDTLEETVSEAKEKGCNLIVSHHPIIFSGIKKLNGKNYVEKTVIAAIKNDIAIFAIHTSLDNVHLGVNKKMADKLGLVHQKILATKNQVLSKLITSAPVEVADKIREALFDAGAGDIGNYSECSFGVVGTGTFKPNAAANPTVGTKGILEKVKEERIEVIFPNYLQTSLVTALKKAHIYEEIAYDVVPLNNFYQNVGSGMVGELSAPVSEPEMLDKIRKVFGTKVIRHTRLLGREVKRIALCGGSGSFLTKKAIAAKADFYITADVKYHEFFDADNRLVIADVGHWESEQYTIDLLFDILVVKFTNFAVLKSALCSNPVFYYL